MLPLRLSPEASVKTLVSSVLDDLLQDYRGGRYGLTPVIVRELQWLREFSNQQRMELHDETLFQAWRHVVGLRDALQRRIRRTYASPPGPHRRHGTSLLSSPAG